MGMRVGMGIGKYGRFSSKAFKVNKNKSNILIIWFAVIVIGMMIISAGILVVDAVTVIGGAMSGGGP